MKNFPRILIIRRTLKLSRRYFLSVSCCFEQFTRTPSGTITAAFPPSSRSWHVSVIKSGSDLVPALTISLIRSQQSSARVRPFTPKGIFIRSRLNVLRLSDKSPISFLRVLRLRIIGNNFPVRKNTFNLAIAATLSSISPPARS